MWRAIQRRARSIFIEKCTFSPNSPDLLQMDRPGESRNKSTRNNSRSLMSMSLAILKEPYSSTSLVREKDRNLFY